METNPLVVIVTPVYNGEAYLREALMSVQAQTYGNIRHVVLDNASTDGSAAIIAELASACPNILPRRNDAVLPLQQNWNKAFSHVPEGAAYVMLLCADDMIHPEAIERFVALAEEDPGVEAVMCQDVFADAVRRANLPSRQEVFNGTAVAQRMLAGALGWLPYCHFFVRMHPEFRGEDFCGDYWSQDPYVVLRSMVRGRFGYISEPLVYTRYHEACSTSTQVQSGGVDLHMNYLRLLDEFGPGLFEPREFQRIKRRFAEQMTRLKLRMMMAGRREGAQLLYERLRLESQILSRRGFALALIRWPAHIARKLFCRLTNRPQIDRVHFRSLDPFDSRVAR